MSNVLSVLSSVSASTASMTQNLQLQEISQDMQNQLQRQIAAIQTPVDQVSINASQAQITNLQTQATSVENFEHVFGTNNNILSNISSQLNTMSQAVTNQDSATFDSTLADLTTNINNLGVPAFNGLFQDTGVTALKTNGINIGSSASYGLSTTDGQTAATATVTAAANLIQNILKANGQNQTISASESQALNGKINALESVQMTQEMNNTEVVATQTQTLTTNMENEIHLIQLNMGQGSAAVATLSAALNPATTQTSIFGTLLGTVGETAQSAQKALSSGNNPSILSIFA